MESPPSDEEIFTGKFTLKEVKQRILFPKRQTFSGCNETQNEETICPNDDIKIIQTRSEPNLLSKSTNTQVKSPTDHTGSFNYSLNSIEDDHQNKINYDNSTFALPSLLTESIITLVESPPQPDTLIEDSPNPNKEIHQRNCNLEEMVDEDFLNLEKLVSELEVDDGKANLNNTFEVVDYILKHGSGQPSEHKSIINNTPVKNNPNQIYQSQKLEEMKPINKQNTLKIPSKDIVKIETLDNLNVNKFEAPEGFTPIKSSVKQETDIFATPVSEMKLRTQLFKTPAQPASLNKQTGSSAKKNLLKMNNYQHIASPIASYINKSPRVPLLKDVKPKKPLPAASSIPKLVKSVSQNSNFKKENVNLPTIAYKSAKKTTVIDIPDKDKLPQSQWARSVTKLLPRPVVMKHNGRENNLTQRLTKPVHEDSFGELSLRQADVSLCTQKSAFK